MATYKFLTGEDVAIPVQLTENDETFVIDAGATVTAVLRHGTTTISAVESCPDDTDWATSLVIAPFTDVETAAIVVGSSPIFATVEVKINDAGDISKWLGTGIKITKGVL